VHAWLITVVVGFQIRLAHSAISRPRVALVGHLLREWPPAAHTFAWQSGDFYDGYRTDVWAMGVTLFALAFGSVPFSDEVSLQPAALTSQVVRLFPQSNNAPALFQKIQEDLYARSFHRQCVMTFCVRRGLQGGFAPEAFHQQGDWSRAILPRAYPCLVLQAFDALLLGILEKDPSKRLSLEQIQVRARCIRVCDDFALS
jgi:serine/threonine protein kinase